LTSSLPPSPLAWRGRRSGATHPNKLPTERKLIGLTRRFSFGAAGAEVVGWGVTSLHDGTRRPCPPGRSTAAPRHAACRGAPSPHFSPARYCKRQVHVISGRTRASLLDIVWTMPASFSATCAPIWRTLGAFATRSGEEMRARGPMACGCGFRPYAHLRSAISARRVHARLASSGFLGSNCIPSIGSLIATLMLLRGEYRRTV
jgi:hypothetical protein